MRMRKHNQLRSMLIEAAWQLVRRDPAMLDYYRELTERMKGQEAIIRVARKLLRRIRAFMLSQKIYVNRVGGTLVSTEVETPALTPPKKRGRPKGK